MATAGSGDVLTGIVLSLLSQGYTSENAAVLGVYLHGLAGDLAAGELCFESIIASDIINSLSDAFNKLREE
jgi:NAD(P)H-hydrate epimerase